MASRSGVGAAQKCHLLPPETFSSYCSCRTRGTLPW